MHHMGGPMLANNMNMVPRPPAPMMGNMGPGGRVGRGGMPAPGKLFENVSLRNVATVFPARMLFVHTCIPSMKKM